MSRDWQALVDRLRGCSYRSGLITPDTPVHQVEFAPGLSDAEIGGTESRFGFRFPPDLREFLQTALPKGPRFPDWRAGDETRLREWLDQPLQGVLFDVERNGFWLPEWGCRPDSKESALGVAAEQVSRAPKLIPVYGHRMIPDDPHHAGNPVFSVHQTDIIYYGHDLMDYWCNEFELMADVEPPAQPRRIRFWDPERFQELRWNEEGTGNEFRNDPV